ncbi:hypothetical protein ATCC90586_004854 [Pythium insidiosum]|nr:hypothetical protein ATCC90586_004854 [Pythium insidiosum]
MTWSYAAFLAEGAALVALSQRQKPETRDVERGEAMPWEWRHGKRPHVDGNAFLVSIGNTRRLKLLPSASALLDITDDADLIECEIVDEDDSEALRRSPLCTTSVVLVDFHIVFHPVYQVPTLFFRACHQDGSPAAIDTQAFFGDHANTGVIAMDEHPVMGLPFHVLHPCETSSAMDLLLSATPSPPHTQRRTTAPSDHPPGVRPSYLLAWLSLVQSVTGINPLQY